MNSENIISFLINFFFLIAIKYYDMIKRCHRKFEGGLVVETYARVNVLRYYYFFYFQFITIIIKRILR